MNVDQVWLELTPIFQDVFDDDFIVPNVNMVADEVDDWDSLGHIRLIVAVECHFKIKFTSAEISGWANVGEFVNAIKTKLG
jgi:acyl carrier protein